MSAPLTTEGAPRSLNLLSVVAPVYNEEATIQEFYTRVCSALEGVNFELVLVDDGSSDGSTASLDQLATNDPRVRVVYLSRNFGHQTALTAGLDHARGDAVVMLDADLQDPPELIARMLDHWRAGCDVVYAVREAARRRVTLQAEHGAVVLQAVRQARPGRAPAQLRRLPPP